MGALLRGFSNPATITGTGTKREAVFTNPPLDPSYLYVRGPQAPVFFSNKHTVPAYVLINVDQDAEATPGGYHVLVPAGTTRELTEGGRVPISRVNAIWASDPGEISITGWNWPGGNRYEDHPENNAAIASVRPIRDEAVAWEEAEVIEPGTDAGEFSGPGWVRGGGVWTKTGQFCNILEITNDYDEPAYVRLNSSFGPASDEDATWYDPSAGPGAGVRGTGHDLIIPAGETMECCMGLLMVRTCSIYLPAGATGSANVVGYVAGRWKRQRP